MTRTFGRNFEILTETFHANWFCDLSSGNTTNNSQYNLFRIIVTTKTGFVTYHGSGMVRWNFKCWVGGIGKRIIYLRKLHLLRFSASRVSAGKVFEGILSGQLSNDNFLVNDTQFITFHGYMNHDIMEYYNQKHYRECIDCCVTMDMYIEISQGRRNKRWRITR